MSFLLLYASKFSLPVRFCANYNFCWKYPLYGCHIVLNDLSAQNHSLIKPILTTNSEEITGALYAIDFRKTDPNTI